MGVIPWRVLRSLRLGEYLELVTLFFLQGAALGIWFVPLSNVLHAHGLQAITPYAFATSAVAAFISPLIFGAMADRHASPVKVLRWLSLATAAAMALATTAIQARASAWVVLALIQLHALCSTPTWSISSSIVFARLQDARKEFGPIRAMATLGWMAGCWAVSLLKADTTALAGYSGAITWLIIGGFTFFLPKMETPKSAEHLTWTQRLGLDALTLLKNRDHRVVFIMLVLFSIPLAAFYPFAPAHLRELGLQHTSAWMTLGQVTEIFAMFALGWLLLRFGLKWVFVCGLAFGVFRFAFSAINTEAWVLLGVLLHGGSYTLVYITAQIYLDQRVDPGVADAGASFDVPAERRRGQSARLSRNGLVVQRLRPSVRPTLADLLGRTGGGGGGGVRLFRDGVSRRGTAQAKIIKDHFTFFQSPW